MKSKSVCDRCRVGRWKKDGLMQFYQWDAKAGYVSHWLYHPVFSECKKHCPYELEHMMSEGQK